MKYYSLKDYYKDFPEDKRYNKLNKQIIFIQGYINILSVNPNEDDKKIHRDISRFIKRLKDAQKNTEKSRLRFKELTNCVA